MFNKKMLALLTLSLAFSYFTILNAQNEEVRKEKIKLHQMDNQHDKNHSDYISEVNNEIKALTDEELNQLLNGKGMGLAKAAELNNYPGPRHVLDFSHELNLTNEQKEKSESVFKIMQTEARQIGKLIIKKEKELDSAFKTNTVEEKIIKEKVMEIAQLKGKLRFVHLDAHLKQKEILTNEQVTTYSKLRGYN